MRDRPSECVSYRRPPHMADTARSGHVLVGAREMPGDEAAGRSRYGPRRSGAATNAIARLLDTDTRGSGTSRHTGLSADLRRGTAGLRAALLPRERDFATDVSRVAHHPTRTETARQRRGFRGTPKNDAGGPFSLVVWPATPDSCPRRNLDRGAGHTLRGWRKWLRRTIFASFPYHGSRLKPPARLLASTKDGSRWA
jgi:hypothetical protein